MATPANRSAWPFWYVGGWRPSGAATCPDYPGEDTRRLGFICGGGAARYSRTRALLSEGDRVWEYISTTGYVGVSEVIGERCRAEVCRFDTPQGPETLLEMDLIEAAR